MAEDKRRGAIEANASSPAAITKNEAVPRCFNSSNVADGAPSATLKNKDSWQWLVSSNTTDNFSPATWPWNPAYEWTSLEYARFQFEEHMRFYGNN